MKHPLFISITLFVLALGCINGFNNTMPKLFLFILFVVYICIPAYLRIHNLVTKYLQARKHFPHSWA
jgi:hypothetical protein